MVAWFAIGDFCYVALWRKGLIIDLSDGYIFGYSCFDKGCPTKALKRTRQCRLVLWVERVWRWLIEVHGLYQQKRKGINTFVCDVSLYVAETPKASLKYHKPPLPIITFGIVAYGFVGQPFSKQLYVQRVLTSAEVLFFPQKTQPLLLAR